MGFKGAESQGRMAAKTSPLAWMANLATGYYGNKAATEADQASTGVRQRFSNDQSAAMQKLQGLPEEQFIGQSATSPFPLIQQERKRIMDARQKRVDAAIGPLTRTNANLGIGLARTGQFPDSIPASPAPQISQVPGPDGKMIPFVTNTGDYGRQTGSFGPPGTTINNMPAAKGETAAAVALGGKVPEVAEASRKEAIDALEKLQNYNQIYTLSKDPALISGFLANPATGLASFGAKMGITGPEAAAKTQEMLTLMAKQTLAASSILKGAISDKEKPFLEQASSGGITYTPEAIARIAQLSAAVEHNKLMRARTQHYGAVSRPGAEGAAQMYPFPDMTHTLPGTEADFPDNNGVVSAAGKPVQAQAAAPTRSIKRRGKTADGRAVVEYSDGTIEYAN
jgi:hypothetical protein